MICFLIILTNQSRKILLIPFRIRLDFDSRYSAFYDITFDNLKYHSVLDPSKISIKLRFPYNAGRGEGRSFKIVRFFVLPQSLLYGKKIIIHVFLQPKVKRSTIRVICSRQGQNPKVNRSSVDSKSPFMLESF